MFCLRGHFGGAERFARHWHDMARLDDAGFADPAIADRELANAVARHKSMFFAEKDAQEAWIDHTAAVSALQLVPTGGALKLLAHDYARMADDGLLLDEPEPFERLLESCKRIEDKANVHE